MSKFTAKATVGRQPRFSIARLGPRTSYALHSFLGQLLFSAVALVGAVLTARLLGPSGRGTLTAWTVVVFMSVVALAGSVPVGMGRAYLKGTRHGLLAPALHHGTLTLLVSIPPATIAVFIGASWQAVVLFCLITVPVSVIAQDVLVVLQAAKRPWQYQSARIVNAAIFTGGLGVLAYTGGQNIEIAVWGFFALGSVAAAVLLVIQLYRLQSSSEGGSLRALNRMGEGSYWGTLAERFLTRLDQIVLFVLAGPSALGIYSVAVNWSEIGQYAGNAIGQGLFEDEDTLGRSTAIVVLKRAVWVVGLFMLGLTIAGIVLIEPIFGQAFKDAKWAAVLLAPGIVARVVGFAGQQILFARGQGMRASAIAGTTLAFAVPCWVIGSLVWGVYGLALASSVVYSMQAILVAWAFRDNGGTC